MLNPPTLKTGEQQAVSIPGGSTTGQSPFSVSTKYLQEEPLLKTNNMKTRDGRAIFFSCAECIPYINCKKIKQKPIHISKYSNIGIHKANCNFAQNFDLCTQNTFSCSINDISALTTVFMAQNSTFWQNIGRQKTNY